MGAALHRRCLAEFVGTFFLIIIGCGAIVVGGQADGLTHEGVAIVWGLIVLTMIYAIGDISGCHINPAVTIAFVTVGRFPVSGAIAYIPAQVAGAVCAAVCLRMV